jgi:hypothetical protein
VCRAPRGALGVWPAGGPLHCTAVLVKLSFLRGFPAVVPGSEPRDWLLLAFACLSPLRGLRVKLPHPHWVAPRLRSGPCACRNGHGPALGPSVIPHLHELRSGTGGKEISAAGDVRIPPPVSHLGPASPRAGGPKTLPAKNFSGLGHDDLHARRRIRKGSAEGSRFCQPGLGVITVVSSDASHPDVRGVKPSNKKLLRKKRKAA